MPEQITRSEKTFRMQVKLVSTDGVELPLNGFALIPEERLVLLEKLAVAAKSLLTSHKEAVADVNKGQQVADALKAVGERVSELEKIWDIRSCTSDGL